MIHSAVQTSATSGLQPQTWAEIDLSAIRRNFHRFIARFPQSRIVILSVKKEAYGHGLAEVARALESEPRLTAFGTATVAEALRLRQAGIRKPVLVFSVLRGDDLESAIWHEIDLTVTDTAEAEAAAAAAQRLERTARIHFKIDTGMGRIGRSAEEASQSLASIAALPAVQVYALYTHLPDGWTNSAGARDQLKQLRRVAGQSGFEESQLHLGGSDALSIAPDAGPIGIRTGIAVYGAHPGLGDLESTLHFKTRVIYRRRVPAGTSISYGRTLLTARETELAIAGAGYGNGYPRMLSNRGEVLVSGRRCPVLGRVCMDQIIVDVTDVPSPVRTGDEVVLLGGPSPGGITPDEFAGWAETTAYEPLTVIGQLNPRRYPGAD